MDDLTPEERAAAHRVRAEALRYRAAAEDANAAAVTAAESFRRLAATAAAGDAADVAAHPDLAELNVQLDGYYDTD